MIKNYSHLKKQVFTLRPIVLLVMLLLFTSEFAFSQNAPTLPFPIFNPFNPYQNSTQNFDLGDPTKLNQTIVYDPITGTYVFRETLGQGLNYRYPSAMTLEEYLNYENSKSTVQNWQEIIEEESVIGRSFELPIKIGSSVGGEGEREKTRERLGEFAITQRTSRF